MTENYGDSGSYDGGRSSERFLPPQDLEAERSVLGGMMLSKDAIADVVELLRGHDFYRPSHEMIYEAIIDLYGRGEPADAVTVADLLNKRQELSRVGGPAVLHELIQSVPTAANASFYAEIVAEKAVLRRLVTAGTKITQLGYQGDGEVEEIVNEAQSEIYKVAENRQSEDYVRLAEIMEHAVDEIEAAGNQGEGLTGVPTDFYDFDELTQGLHGGQMIVIAARPAVGKSTLALDFARAAAIHHNMATVFFSLEMGKNEIAMRLLSAEATIALQDLRKGTIRDDQWSKIAATVGRLNEAPFFIDDSPNMTMMEIRTKARAIKRQHGLDLVVLVLRDNAYGMIKWKQQHEDYPVYGMDYGNPDFVRYAESYGARGHRPDSAAAFADILRTALDTPGVDLIDLAIDYSDDDALLNTDIPARSAAID